jgi:hypothetical protein
MGWLTQSYDVLGRLVSETTPSALQLRLRWSERSPDQRRVPEQWRRPSATLATRRTADTRTSQQLSGGALSRFQEKA